MLISFSVENFRSFKEEATLILEAGKGKEMRESHTFTPKLKNGVKSVDLLRSAVIYGPNAGGKSNFFESFRIMSNIVRISRKEHEKLPIIPFMLNKKTEKTPSVFEIVTEIDGVRYQYGFSATKERIHGEWLLAFPKGKTQTWLERTYNKKTKEYEYPKCDALKGQKKVWEKSTNSKTLFLSMATQMRSDQLKPIYDWFINNIHFISADSISPQASLEYCKKQDSKKIIAFLKAADFTIEDIVVIEKPFPEISSKETSKAFINFFNSFKGIIDEMELPKLLGAETIHKDEDGEPVNMALEMESDGTQRILSLAVPILVALEHGRVLVVDELNQRLHPALMQFLISLFHDPKNNKKGAQLIFTSHAVSLLKNDIFRRDQIWFCEREKNQATILFPLSDFKPRKGHEDFEGYYMGGRYGALPFIGDFPEAIKKDTKK